MVRKIKQINLSRTFIMTNLAKTQILDRSIFHNNNNLISWRMSEPNNKFSSLKFSFFVWRIVLIYATSRTRSTASQILKSMNPDVEPCDDFYKFACGGFLETTIIPDDKTSVNTFSIIFDALAEQLRANIEQESLPNEPKPYRLARDFYKACMNKSKRWREMIFSRAKSSRSHSAMKPQFMNEFYNLIAFTDNYIFVKSQEIILQSTFSRYRGARLAAVTRQSQKTWRLASFGRRAMERGRLHVEGFRLQIPQTGLFGRLLHRLRRQRRFEE